MQLRTRTPTRAALATCLMVSFGSNALALDAGQCATSSEMTAALKSEGQRSLVIACRVAAARFLPAQTITSNSRGDGYLLEGDKPIGTPSSSFCVALKLSELHLLDARKPGVPSTALIGGRHDEALKYADKKGSRPVIFARSVFPQGFGDYVTISANLRLGTGDMEFAKPNGDIKLMAVYSGIKYTDTALEILK